MSSDAAMRTADRLLRRIRVLTAVFILGLVLSGLTAIPLVPGIEWLAGVAGSVPAVVPPDVMRWLETVREALVETAGRHPFLFYGTDWLAFGHLVIALAFVGAWRDPVRNRWLYDFGLIACALVIPWALIFGALRGVPVWWRWIDGSFGVLGAVPLGLCRRWVRQLAAAPRGLRHGVPEIT